MDEPTFTSSEFYRHLAEQRLMASRCQACGELHVPPRPICPACHSQEMVWVEMQGHGRLLAYTLIYIAPTAMLAAGYGRTNPYCTGLVQLSEGPTISAQIVDVDTTRPEQIAIGGQLELALVQRGEGDQQRTFLVFRPVAS